MGNLLQNKEFVLPVTALAFVQLHHLYLLAGEGKYLKIFEHETKQLVWKRQIFESQAIHGIFCQKVPLKDREQALLLIWGGRSICVLAISINRENNGEVQVEVADYVTEIQAQDWVLDGCFKPLNIDVDSLTETRLDAFLVTAHNELLYLRVNLPLVGDTQANYSLSCIGAGPCSILYSAHIIWLLDSRAFVAAGTVFGEVLVWSFHDDYSNDNSHIYLHNTFTGHEGSVFGVRISEIFGETVVASCSDDRTIRLWRISEDWKPTPHRDAREETLTEKRTPDSLSKDTLAGTHGCVAMVMAHVSRIWGLRFLDATNGYWKLLSHGEDSTSQTWTLKPRPELNVVKGVRNTQLLDLAHEQTYSYHSGKNIWAVAVHTLSCDDYVVAIGGADGRIVNYRAWYDSIEGGNTWSSRCTMEEALTGAESMDLTRASNSKSKLRTVKRQIFDSLMGEWRILRTIDSVIRTYPSGTLGGTATFKQRPPTDGNFTAEYLYSEVGDFVTEEGLRMRATRQYVYRYNEETDSITVWFVKIDDGSTVDYFFHELSFPDIIEGVTAPSGDCSRKTLTATGYHLCVEDNYTPEYTFLLRDWTLERWSVTFAVQGPNKDYTTKTEYSQDDCLKITNSKASVKSDSGPLQTVKGTKERPTRKKVEDAFKTYSWIGQNEFLTSTDLGTLLIGTVDCERKTEAPSILQWQRLSQQQLLRSSSLASSLPCMDLAFLTGMEGAILLYKHSTNTTEVVYNLPRKCAFLKAQRLLNTWLEPLFGVSETTMVGLLATYLGTCEAIALIFQFDINSSNMLFKSTISLNLPSDFIVTSDNFLNSERVILLGSRSGEIAIYNLQRNPLTMAQRVESCQSQRIHKEAITVIQIIPSKSKETSEIHILTAGRDGTYRLHKISITESIHSTHLTNLQTLHTGTPPFGPNIEGAYISGTDLFLWGFRSKEFVVWNETQKTETMTVNCGGAHRNWTYTHNRDGRGGGSFVYTKASVCHVHTQTQAFHQVFQHGSHGREIKAMALSPSLVNDNKDGIRYLATGAEDTAIRIHELNTTTTTTPPKHLTIITKHTTGLQKLQWSTNGHYLFSAAGCEELFAWRIRPAPLVGIGVVCEATCPVVSEEVDLRIMNLATLPIYPPSASLEVNHEIYREEEEPDYLISTAYSDSSLRIFRYQTHSQTFVLLFKGLYTTHCLTQITYIHVEQTLYLCTSSTDGHIALWPLPLTSTKPIESGKEPYLLSTPHSLPSPSQPTITHTHRIPIHQNSIKSLLAIPLNQNQNQSTALITTAGDDGAIAFTLLSHTPPNPLSHATLLIPKAHASAVTAIAYIGPIYPNTQDGVGKHRYRFASVSNDQRLNIWSVSVDLTREGVDGLEVRKGADVGIGVADASSLVVEGGGENGNGGGEDGDRTGGVKVCVAGIGMEWWRVGHLGTETERIR